MLHESERMRQVFREPPIVAFRRDRNLSDTLVHSKTNRVMRNDPDNSKSNCEMYGIISASQVAGCNSGRMYSVPSNVNCEEKNVVYAISCRICERVVYVGETERQLHEGMREYMRDVRLKKDKPINYHFSQMNHSHSDLKFTILEKMYSAGKIERQMHESAWIKKLHTVQPLGCNIKDVQFHITLCDV